MSEAAVSVKWILDQMRARFPGEVETAMELSPTAEGAVTYALQAVAETNRFLHAELRKSQAEKLQTLKELKKLAQQRDYAQRMAAKMTERAFRLANFVAPLVDAEARRPAQGAEALNITTEKAT